jgi:hypothetical protein
MGVDHPAELDGGEVGGERKTGAVWFERETEEGRGKVRLSSGSLPSKKKR